MIKTKVINFRLSDGEYVRLRQECSLAGIDNVSEFTRAAIQQFIGSLAEARKASGSEDSANLKEQLDHLSHSLDQMAAGSVAG